MLAIIFLYLCFTGTMFIENLIMLDNPYPLFVAGARILGGGLMLLALYIFKNKSISFGQLKELRNQYYIKYVVSLYIVFVSASAWSMQYMDPVKACFIFVLSPFMTALMLYFWYKEKLSLKKISGLFIGFFSVIPIILQSNSGEVNQTSSQLVLLAYGIYALAVTSFAYGWIIYNKQVEKQVNLPSALVTSIALIIGGSVTLFIFCLTSSASIFTMQLTNYFYWQLLFFIILTAFGYYLYAALLKRYSATFISFASFLQPAFGLIIGVLFFNQGISTVSIIALCALAFGLFLFSQEELSYK